MQQTVIIVQGASSAFLYFQECLLRGLLPVVVNPPGVNPGYDEFVDRVGDKAVIIDMKSDDEYDVVLDRIKSYKPIAVVCGGGGGVFLTDKLAKDLGLKGNDPETTWLRDTKAGMHHALKEAGIRYIRTAVIKSIDDVDKFWDEVQPKKVMVKYDNGAGTVGNRICHSRDDVKIRLTEMLGTKNIFGNVDNVLVQEFIEGDEYIVDTVSCDGNHLLTDIWKYKKVFTKDNAVIYDYAKLMVNPSPGVYELVRYAFRVLDALKFRYGPCHGEFKIDENGPVLIETNPRPLGMSMTIDFLDASVGNHVTDIALDAYLEPMSFFRRRHDFYLPRRYAVIKTVISPKECDINLNMMNQFLKDLKSYSSASIDFTNMTLHSPKTVDLETIPFSVKLCSSDYETILNDLEILREFERDYFDLMLDRNKIVEASSTKPDLNPIINALPRYFSTLIVTDEEEYGIKYGKKSRKGEGSPKYNIVIFACCQSSTLAERFKRFNEAVDSLSVGGMIAIVPQAWEKLPYGISAAEFIIRVTGCRIAIPLSDKTGVMFAYKK